MPSTIVISKLNAYTATKVRVSARRVTPLQMVERSAHLAPDPLATAVNRLDSLLGGYDLATPKRQKGVSEQR